MFLILVGVAVFDALLLSTIFQHSYPFQVSFEEDRTAECYSEQQLLNRKNKELDCGKKNYHRKMIQNSVFSVDSAVMRR